MNYFAYIESPLQAFNLMEYTGFANIEIDILIINKKTLVSKKNYPQILSVVKNIKIKKIIDIDIESGKGNVLKIWKLVKLYVPRTDVPYTLICGEYRSMIFWYICGRFLNRRVIMLDDGTATLRINRKNRTIKSAFRNHIYRILGFIDVFLEPIVFFSVYDIHAVISGKDRLIAHKYDFFKKKMESFPTGDNVVYVIGSPFLEAGVVNDDDIKTTLGMIEKLKCKYPKVIYISHRREREEKLLAINKHVLVERLDYPFELLPLVLGKRIKAIAGFYSSLFDNMHIICGDDLDIECFYLPQASINPSWSAFVSDVYKNYLAYPGQAFKFHSLV